VQLQEQVLVRVLVPVRGQGQALQLE
jgi:hypothetical protein